MSALHSSVVSSRGSRRPDERQAVHARQVAGVGELPGQADRGVEAVLELVDEPAADGRSFGCERSCGALLRIDARRRRGCRGRRGTPPARRRGRRRAGERGADVGRGRRGVVRRRPACGVLRKLQPAGAEVVGQRPERLGPQRHRVGCSRQARSSTRRARAASVDAAHAVDGDLFDELVLGERLAVDSAVVRSWSSSVGVVGVGHGCHLLACGVTCPVLPRHARNAGPVARPLPPGRGLPARRAGAPLAAAESGFRTAPTCPAASGLRS